MRIGTVVSYRLPPKGRRKKKTNWMKGIVVGNVPANTEPSANYGNVMFIGYDKYDGLHFDKDTEGNARNEDSLLVMDEDSKKVHWPLAEDVRKFTDEDFMEVEVDNPEEIEEALEEIQLLEEIIEEAELLENDSAGELAEALDAYESEGEFVEDVVEKLKEAGFEEAAEDIDEG